MAVRIAHLDTLLGLTGEIIIAASNLSILQRHIASGDARADPETAEMIKQSSLSTSRISSDLHHLVMDIRLVAIKETFLRFRRLVRDIARMRGRQVEFEIVGADTLVDKTVAEKLYEPLAHQIRNAIDHGLEDPLERQQAGKAPTGRLTLGAYKREDVTCVFVRDDGKGLDADRIRRRAAEMGLCPPGEEASLSTRDVWAFILRPGFSTASEATEISGRGVGMDVVRSVVGALGGEVDIESAPGAGSTFTYRIPQLSAVNITDAVVVRAGEGFFAIPVGNVVATLAIKPRDVHTALGGRGDTIFYLGSLLPLHGLRDILAGGGAPGGGTPSGDATVPVIIVEAKNGRIACRVSEFIRPQKLVLIPLPDGFTPKGVAGTTILGGSQLGLILDPFELVAMASGTALDPNALADRPQAVTDAPAAPAAPRPDAGEAPAAGPPGPAAGGPGPAPAGDALPEGGVAEEFFTEIQEILKAAGEDIFQLDRDPGDMARVHTIFRHFHSVKGNFIMTGFGEVGRFVHDVETVLDQIREKKIQVSQEIIDLLLDAVKNMEEGLRTIRAGRKYVVEDENLLQLVARHKVPPAETAPGGPPEDDGVFRFSPLGTLLYQARRADPQTTVYQGLFRLRPTFQDPSLAAYLAIRRLALAGEIIDTAPGLERIENGFTGDRVKVMFASRLGLEEMRRFCERQLRRHFAVESFELFVPD